MVKTKKGITIIGLGPGSKDLLTIEAERILGCAKEVYVRTMRHPTIDELPRDLVVHSFDRFYEEKDTFSEVYQAIAERILELGSEAQGVVYAVPGHPLVAEESVRLILSQAPAREIPVHVVDGLSFLEPVFTALGLDPFHPALQLYDAAELAARLEAPSGKSLGSCEGASDQPDPIDESAIVRSVLSPESPLLLCQVYSRSVASVVKLGLLEIYPDEHQIALVRAAGIASQAHIEWLPLFELDRREIDHLTTLYVPPLTPKQDLSSFETLRAVVARLRGPNGCPWDREQTTESLKPYLIEEAYEVLDAIDSGDHENLTEELGDVLLQVVLHSQVASERDDFSIEDVIEGVSAKLIRRHPHVFGDWTVSGTSEVLRNWEQIKRAEKATKVTKEGEQKSLISPIPKHTPALAYAQTLQRRAARVGFDWPAIDGVLDKLQEEIGELRAAKDQDERVAEYGDVLFSLVNLARWLNVDSEESLRMASQRFLKRFHRMEEFAAARGQDFTKLSIDEQERLWQEAKGG